MRISDWSSDVCSSDLQRRRFDAGLLARVIIDHLDLVAAPLRPPRVHSLEHLGPVLAFVAASPGLDFDINVVGIGLARQQGGNLVLVGAICPRRPRRYPVPGPPLPAFGLPKFDSLTITPKPR